MEPLPGCIPLITRPGDIVVKPNAEIVNNAVATTRFCILTYFILTILAAHLSKLQSISHKPLALTGRLLLLPVHETALCNPFGGGGGGWLRLARSRQIIFH